MAHKASTLPSTLSGSFGPSLTRITDGLRTARLAPGDRSHFALIAAGAIGFAAALVAVASIALSVLGFPGYSPAHYFISQLADPINPMSPVLNGGFILAGLLAAAFSAWLIARTREVSLRAASVFALLAALSLIMVGVFPFTDPVAHHVFAIALCGCVIAATWLLARWLRRQAARPAAPIAVHRASSAVTLLSRLQIGCVALDLLYVAIVATLVSPDAVPFPEPLAAGVGAVVPTLNPSAMLEWMFFGTALVMLAMLGGWLAVQGARSAARSRVAR